MQQLLTVGAFRRRIVTIPALLIGSTLLWLCSPLILATTVAVDLLTGPRRLRLTRLVLFALNYSLLEIGAVLAAGVLWPITGFGTCNRQRWAMKLHADIERWWVTSVMRATQRWMNLDIHVDDLELLHDGPMVIAAHHVSFFDAVLPAVLLAWAESPAIPRYTLKRELLLSPALDLIGNRLPNHWVDRTPSLRAVELDGFRRLAQDLDGDALVVFPEGTFHTDQRAVRAVARVHRSDPARADLLRPLRHMLPLRPGGVSALLETAPHADLVLIAHRGLSGFGSTRTIIAKSPLHGQVTVHIRRIPAAELPDNPAARTRFLDEQWLTMDRWISELDSTGTAPDPQDRETTTDDPTS